MRILPRHIRDLIQVPEIATVHKLCVGMSQIAANIACLHILSQWPLYGASFFEVSVSWSSMDLCYYKFPLHLCLSFSEIYLSPRQSLYKFVFQFELHWVKLHFLLITIISYKHLFTLAGYPLRMCVICLKYRMSNVIYTTKIGTFVCPPHSSETVAVTIMKLAHCPRIASTTKTLISKQILLSILSILFKTI